MKTPESHPPGAKPNERIAKAIRGHSLNGTLASGIAEKISKRLKVDLSEVGITAIKLNSLLT